MGGDPRVSAVPRGHRGRDVGTIHAFPRCLAEIRFHAQLLVKSFASSEDTREVQKETLANKDPPHPRLSGLWECKAQPSRSQHLSPWDVLHPGGHLAMPVLLRSLREPTVASVGPTAGAKLGLLPSSRQSPTASLTNARPRGPTLSRRP